MRVAVYAIALNEEAFVERWLDSTRDADYHLIVDTGSTDETVAVARGLGIRVEQISVRPWRFDMARNASLALLPADFDMCVPLDLDEVMLPGWREGIEREWDKGITRPRYNYTFSWNVDGSPGIQFFANKIHARKGFRWRYPIHEVAECYDGSQVESFNPDIVMHHRPDPTKSRGSYLPLLRMAAAEEPHDARCSYYLARELYFHKHLKEAAAEFRRYLALPSATWTAERAHAYRWLARCEPWDATEHLKASLVERDHREAWADLAWMYYKDEQWQECLNAAAEALAHETPPTEYQTDSHAWGPMVPDLASIAAWRLGLTDDAIRLCEMALAIHPHDLRLEKNLRMFQGSEDLVEQSMS